MRKRQLNGLLIVVSVFAHLTLPVMANLKTNAHDEGKDLAAKILNHDLKPSTSQASVTQLMQGLGVDSHTIGGPSSDAVDAMGISGTTFTTFHFSVKPACHNGIQHLIGLAGTTLALTCQKGGNAIMLNICIASSLQTTCQPKTLELPLTGRPITQFGYLWQAHCDPSGICQGKMAQTSTVAASGDTLVQTGVQKQKNNAAYQSIYATYASRSGYNRTQAYMKSFGDKGSNNWLSKCTAGMPGYLANGRYYSCSAQQSGDLNNDCVVVKHCIHYQRHDVSITTHEQCRLTALDKSVDCTRWPKVTVVTVPYPVPVPDPCTHVIAVLRGQKPPAGAVLLAYTENWYRYATLYRVSGPNADNACYIPGSIHVEHDRNQHGASSITTLTGATYFFYAQAWYYKQQGYADLYVQLDGNTVSRIRANANQGARHNRWVATKAGRVILNGYNHGFDDHDYDDAYSAYWAAVPVHQTHKVAHVTWKEDCGVGS